MGDPGGDKLFEEAVSLSLPLEVAKKLASIELTSNFMISPIGADLGGVCGSI
jgi:hypothetical protein